MDVFARTGKRAWLVGAATAGLLTPALLSGQANRPAPSTARSPATQQASLGVPVAESEVEQQLRLLYERDGREMPNLRLSPPPNAQQPTPPPSQVPGYRPATTPVRPRYSAAPPAPPPQKSPNRMTSFFKKLIPGGSKSPAAQSPPRPLPPAPPQPPFASPSQAVLRQPASLPQPPEIPPGPTQPVVDHLVNNLATDPTNEVVPLPAPVNDDQEPFDDENLDLDEGEGLSFEPPVHVEVAPETPRLVDDFPDPFFGASEEATPEEEVEMNPYTGRSLDDTEPATLPTETDIKPVTSAVDPTVDESTAAKMRRIIQRTDMKGLKGFCPVTLRDQRELADSRPEFMASYRGQKFYFASKAAQAKFQSDPSRYAPAAYGADVVVLVNEQDVVEGSLDYAAWYKGRLYLFSSQETHDLFVAQPERFASPPGIE